MNNILIQNENLAKLMNMKIVWREESSSLVEQILKWLCWMIWEIKKKMIILTIKDVNLILQNTLLMELNFKLGLQIKKSLLEKVPIFIEKTVIK